MGYSAERIQMESRCWQAKKRKRNGTVTLADNRSRNVIQNRKEGEVSKKQLNAGGNFPVIQGVLTRGMVRNWVEAMKAGTASKEVFLKLDEYDQYLILSVAREWKINVSAFQTLIQKGDSAAEMNSDIDHPDSIDAKEYTFEEVCQLRRGPGISGPRSNALMTNICYMRDSNGNINFSSPHPPVASGTWNNPVKVSSTVDLEEGSPKKNFGVLKNGKCVNISDASRSQHFSIANRVAEKKGQTYSPVAGNSPDGYTWHHLLDKYKMVLVDRKTHQQFGHNGGYYFW